MPTAGTPGRCSPTTLRYAAAVAALRTLIEDRRLDQDLRERALFWLVAAGSDDAFAYVSALLAEG
jgi:hypothetical protein